MSSVDVGVECGKLVVEGIADETLCCEVIAFLRLNLAEYLVNARKALERSGVESNSVSDMRDPVESMPGILERDPTH
jgi:hypothetical protein